MHSVPTTMTVADYCEGMIANQINVNSDYQRSDKVWPPMARSFFIETIILGYPFPKISLYQKTELKTRKTVKQIVDGQQRSRAIRDFYENRLRLSKNVETERLKGRKYKELEEEDQANFLAYAISIDLITLSTEVEVREIFRRMNSYTVPLNPEEQRHANYQGEFKWFVRELARKNQQQWEEMGLFSRKSLLRMADAKLITEISHAYFHGIMTTKKKELDSIYKQFDRTFDEQEKVGEKFQSSFDLISEMKNLYNSSIMKPHVIYSLSLAILHTRYGVSALDSPEFSKTWSDDSFQLGVERISALAEALDDPDNEGNRTFLKFVQACSERTNVADQRKERFSWFCCAFSGEWVQ